MAQPDRKLPARKVMGILFAFFCVNVVIMDHCAENDFKKAFLLFNSANLKGRITYLYASGGGERFRLNTSDKVYRFSSKANPSNEYANFYEIADIDDSIIKPALSDTLLLIKRQSGKRFIFRFHKPT